MSYLSVSMHMDIPRPKNPKKVKTAKKARKSQKIISIAPKSCQYSEFPLTRICLISSTIHPFASVKYYGINSHPRIPKTPRFIFIQASLVAS